MLAFATCSGGNCFTRVHWLDLVDAVQLLFLVAKNVTPWFTSNTLG